MINVYLVTDLDDGNDDKLKQRNYTLTGVDFLLDIINNSDTYHCYPIIWIS